MINQISTSAALLYQTDAGKKTTAKSEKKAAGEDTAAYSLELSYTSQTKSSKALSSDEIDNIMDQADATTSALRDVVEKLIVNQEGKNSAYSLNVTILAAESEGLADISEDAEWGVEAVSDRIVDFAKSISGGDPSKIEVLREAIDKGFASAKKALGGKLPGVSMDTYDTVMSKLDDWAAESQPAAAAE
jgi:gas vesicle protein